MYQIHFSIIIFVLLISGCTHNIQMSPTLSQIRIFEPQKKIHKKVGYYISSEDKKQIVIMSAGAGDSVSYKPYYDSEAALSTVLSKIFDRVYSVKSIDDKEYIQNKNISYIFIPKIITQSRSEGALTWVPTHFTVQISCKAIDPQGNQIWDKEVKAIGSATFGDMGNDYSLAARRASAKAFIRLMEEISKAEEL